MTKERTGNHTSANYRLHFKHPRNIMKASCCRKWRWFHVLLFLPLTSPLTHTGVRERGVGGGSQAPTPPTSVIGEGKGKPASLAPPLAREEGRGGKQGGERKGEAGRGEKGGVKEWGAHTRGRSGYRSLHMYWTRHSTILKDKGCFKDCTWNFVPLWALKDGHLFSESMWEGSFPPLLSSELPLSSNLPYTSCGTY